jgi:putative transport protein
MTVLGGLLRGESVTSALFVLSLVSALGLGLGRLRVRGIGLGSAGVLFAGLAIGRLGIGIAPELSHLVKELGLILFVFTIGMQIGPGFLASIRRHGLLLNALAATVVVLGAVATVGLAWLVGIPPPIAVGLFCGATTNTPALGAAQEVLSGAGIDPGAAGMGYALGYPFGVLGTIGSLILLRWIFGMDVRREVRAFEATEDVRHEPVEHRSLVVQNPALDGSTLQDVPRLAAGGVVVSRLRRAEHAEAEAVRADTRLHVGDVVLAVATRRALDELEKVLGARVAEDLMDAPGIITTRRILVTHDRVLGNAIHALESRVGVTCTRVTRSGLELVARPELRVQFGDVLQVVGTEDAIAETARWVGNATRELDVTRLGAVFLGILLGILLGTVPIRLPGLPVALRLGLAAGPLLAAIVLSAVGRLGRVVFYMPTNANLALRELGITLFMASVGLGAGAHFAAHPLTLESAGWVGAGAAVTVVPLVVVGIVSRLVLRLDYVRLCGLVAGSMTDPPALAFGNALLGGDAASTTYAAVYPLTMVLRVVTAQMLALVTIGGG